MLRYDAVVFDLDGTLTDSAEGITNSARYALQQMNHPIPEDKVLLKFLGPPLVASFRNFCNMDEQTAIEATGLYRERYMPIGWKENKVFKGIRSILQALKARGAHLYIATAKPQDISISILKYFGMDHYFDVISGALPGEMYPDKGDIIGRALKNKTYQAAVMVGDRGSDLRGAQKFGIDSIAAGYGYGSEEELRQAEPTHYAHTVCELSELLLGEVPAEKGYFISMEGLDGCGKTTQMATVNKFLQDMGFDVLISREPGGCPISEKIRALLLDVENAGMSDICEALLYAAARAQHVHQVIKPAVANGKIVLCDRFVDSSIAFQGGGRQLGAQLVEQINAPAVDGCLPHVTIYLRTDYKTAHARRIKAAVPDRIEREQLSFHQRVENGYDLLSSTHSGRYIVVDAGKTADTVADDIRQKLLKRLIHAGVA